MGVAENAARGAAGYFGQVLENVMKHLLCDYFIYLLNQNLNLVLR